MTQGKEITVFCAHDKLVDIENIIPNPRNPNKHPESQLKLLTKIIEIQGWRAPITVSKRSGFIVRGHARLDAAKRLGCVKVPVDYQDYKTEADEYADMVADNRIAELAEPSLPELKDLLEEFDDGEFDMDLFGYDDKALEDLMNQFHVEDVVEDEAPEPPEVANTKLGDVFLLGEHRLMCGDSTVITDVDKLMAGNKADTVFTSPPYAVGLEYGEYLDSIENLRGMLRVLPALWKSVIVLGGFAVVNFGDIASAGEIVGADGPCEYPMATEYWGPFRDSKWVLWSRRVWCKPNPRVHSLQCIGSNRAATDFEHIWTWKNNGKAIVERIDGKYRSCMGWLDTTSDTGVAIGKDTHGAGMALSIAIWMVNVHSRHNKIVLDPFGGTGTTLIAAEQLNRKCYMMEIDPKYCDVIIERYRLFKGLPDGWEPERADG